MTRDWFCLCRAWLNTSDSIHLHILERWYHSSMRTITLQRQSPLFQECSSALIWIEWRYVAHFFTCDWLQLQNMAKQQPSVVPVTLDSGGSVPLTVLVSQGPNHWEIDIRRDIWQYWVSRIPTSRSLSNSWGIRIHQLTHLCSTRSPTSSLIHLSGLRSIPNVMFAIFDNVFRVRRWYIGGLCSSFSRWYSAFEW